MKKLLIMYKKQFVAMSVLVVGLVIGFGTITFAEMPHTDTKLISACRDNSTGSLRVIDAQASETCDTGETSLTWSGAQSAIARFDPSDSFLENGLYNASKSRNISSYIVGSYDDGNGNDYGTGYCINVNFTPRFVSPTPTYSLSDGGSEADLVTNACGLGYDYFLKNTSGITYYFTE